MLSSRLQLTVKIMAVVVALATVEALLQLLHYPFLGCKEVLKPDEVTMGQFNPDIGWGWKPNSSYFARGVSYHFDDLGIRTSAYRQPVDFSKPRLLFVGDSVAFGFGLNYEETYAAKIGYLLGDHYSIVNAAVEGYGSDQAYLRLQQLIEYVRPTAVVTTVIADHTYRNLNYDRRQTTRCIDFLATKSSAVVRDNELVWWRRPQLMATYSRLKIPILMHDVYDQTRWRYAVETGYDAVLFKTIVRKIAETQLNDAFIPHYFIYYDNRYSTTKNDNDWLVDGLFTNQHLRVLPMYNWAPDSLTGPYYVFPGEDYFHPNDKLTNLMAEKFVHQFGSELRSLSIK